MNDDRDRMIRAVLAGQPTGDPHGGQNHGEASAAADDKPDVSTVGLVVRRLADVPAEKVTWLWTDRIPFGKLTVLGGDPGVGKSYITTAIAAAVTRGARLPDDDRDRPPADVLMASFEDDAGDTIRPRADLLGVDPQRVTIIEGATGDDGKVRPFCAADIGPLAATLDGLDRPRLLVIDPVAAWVGGTVDTFRDNEVRAALEGLRRLAADRDIAVLLVMHLRKSTASNALARLSGSGAYGQLIRSALLAGRDPDDEDRCALAHVKSNLAARQATLGYRIDQLGLTWTGVIDDLDGERLAGHDPDDRRDARTEAEGFLREVLADGPKKASDVQATAAAADLSWDAIKRSKKRLGVETERHGFGPGSYVTWSLSVTDDPAGLHREHREHIHMGAPYADRAPYGATESDGVAALKVAHAPPGAPCARCGHPCAVLVNDRRIHAFCHARSGQRADEPPRQSDPDAGVAGLLAEKLRREHTLPLDGGGQ